MQSQGSTMSFYSLKRNDANLCSLSNQIKIPKTQYHAYQSSHGDNTILKLLRSLWVNLNFKQHEEACHSHELNNCDGKQMKNREKLNQDKKSINLMTFRDLGRQLGLKDLKEYVLNKF